MQKKERKPNLILFFMLLICAALLSGCAKERDDINSNPNGTTVPEVTGLPEDSVFTDNLDGTVSFTYCNESDKKFKVVIETEDGKMYQYDVCKGDCSMTLPLSQGNGTYKLYFCKNVKDNKYSIVESASIKLALEDERQAFLNSNVIIDWNETNEAIKKAQKLTKDLDDDKSKLETIYEYMVENYSYDYDKAEKINKGKNDIAYIPDIAATYDTKTGICYDLASLFAAMLRSVDIPAKVVTGYTSNNISYHAWNDVFYSPKQNWEIIDITYDIEMFSENKRYYIFKKAKDYEKIIYIY